MLCCKFSKIVLITGVCIVLTACTINTLIKGDDTMSDELYQMPENCDFNKVFNADTHSNECTPILDNKFFSKFSGLLINGPEQVVWPKDADPNDYPAGPWGTSEGPLRLMVAGLVRVQYKMLELKGEAAEHVLLVAVNQKTAKSYSGRMPQPDVVTEPDFDTGIEEDPASEAEENALLNSYFNFDLVHDLGLPIAEASYNVYATLGDLKSNAIVVKTKVK